VKETVPALVSTVSWPLTFEPEGALGLAVK